MAPKKGKGKDKDKDKGKGKPDDQKQKPPKTKKPPPPPAVFTNEDLMKYKDIFVEFDEDKIDRVPITSVPTMLRRLGYNPKGAEVAAILKKFLADEFQDTIELHTWYFIIEAKLKCPDDFENEVVKAMAFLGHDDEEKGIINLEVLRQELSQWGEPLSELEFVDWPKIAIKEKVLVYESNDFTYEKFVEIMNAKDVRAFSEPINYFKLDQRQLAALAMEKAMKEKEEIERREQERAAREELKRMKMIADGLIPE